MTRDTAVWLGIILLGLMSCGQQSCTPDATSDAGQPATAYDQMLRVLYQHTVPVVLPTTLAATLRQDSAAVLLLDTRTPAEYRVSHLPGARLVNFDHFRELNLQQLSRTRPVVVYCTVGARSEQVGAWLRQQGLRDVRNLYGGVFQWVNEGHSVVDTVGPTTRVHPYSLLWRPWLKRGTAAYQ